MEIGKFNALKVSRKTEHGCYLTDDNAEEVLLPKRYCKGMNLGDEGDFFVYIDSDGRAVATTEHPYAVVGDFALMRVKAVNAVGAFLDWGLMGKDLLVPFREQRVKMSAGRSYVVHIYVDRSTGRIVASAKLGKFLSKDRPDYKYRQEVNILVTQRTEMGYKVIVDDAYWGQIYANEIYRDVNVGDRLSGYVKFVRPDWKIDITLEENGKTRTNDVSGKILEYLKSHDGQMSITDKSDPRLILDTFNCSKRDFKRALGLLFKHRFIVIGDDAVTITELAP